MTLPDIPTLDSYGGAKENARLIVNPTTQEDATHRNAFVTDTAMMARLAVRAGARFAGHATTPADPASGFIHDAQWGAAAPVKATVTRSGAGIYLVTWPATITDPLGTTRTLSLRVAEAWVEATAATYYAATARITAANVAEVRVFSDFATLDDAAGANIVVLAR